MNETKEGKTKVIDTRGTVEEAEREFTETHLGKGRRGWYIQKGKLIRPLKKREGKGCRKKDYRQAK